MSDLMASLTVVTKPASEPVTLAEAKEHLKVPADITAEDTLIQGFVSAAREQVEQLTWRAVMSQSLRLVLDRWPEPFRLPRPPLIQIDSIKYYDASGVLQTLDSSNYRLIDGDNAALYPISRWPNLSNRQDAVTVNFQAGHQSSGDVPESIKAAILLFVGHLYNNREDVKADTPELRTFHLLISPHRFRDLQVPTVNI